jgi:uncharacterized protein (TIGR02246 family)
MQTRVLPVFALTLLLAPTRLSSIPLAVRPPIARDHQQDEAAIRQLAATWQDAWNRRNADDLASIMDPNVVFVSVLGPETPTFGRGGRDAFRAAHASMLPTMFANSRWTNESVTVVRWLRPDVAVAHVVWRTTGDRVRHVKHGAPRYGMFTWVVEKQAGKWIVVASQNTEAMPPLPGQ